LLLKRIEHKELETAKKLYEIWQESYIVEKELLGVVDFPPLNRLASDFVKSKNDFQGLYEKKELLGVIEIAQKLNSVHLQSLVVDPNHFRKGIATKLINKVFDLYPATTYTVETGNSNIPAKKLYESLGFKKNKVWIAEFGIEKIKYKKK
tara:strand:+ start:83 stop:532 length:450 start_codon:yes stop_codon:yes gene_type:complete